MNVVTPVSRNARCPCGSGVRYKECHGALQPASDPAGDARAMLERGDIAGAKRAARSLLEQSPQSPHALEVLARCTAKEGEALAALRLWLRTVRVMASSDVSPAFAFSAWQELGYAFLEALHSVDTQSDVALRTAYRHWSASRNADSAGAAVSVVIVVPSGNTDGLETTLSSVAGQTRPPQEIVIVPIGHDVDAAYRAAVADMSPSPVRWLDAAATKADALNAGVASTATPWIVAVETPNSFAADHLSMLVAAVGRAGATWGFSGATVAPVGEVPAARLAAARILIDGARSTLAMSDSLGLALIDRAFVGVGEGAMIFARTLFDELGGFRTIGANGEAWDFALRAALVDEPVSSAAATYLHAVRADEEATPQAEWDSAQLALFRPFYALAANPAHTARNPYAPTLRCWGVAFLRRLFRTGHMLMVDVEALERFASLIEERSSPARATLTPGVNLVGFPYAEFGLGENLRAMARGCVEAGVPFAVNEIEHALATRQTDRTLEQCVVQDLRHRLTLMCANPDVIDGALPWLERTRRAGGRTAGYWFWELETLPRAWLPAIDEFDELWCATEFVAGAMRKATTKPVVKVPPAVEVRLARGYRRSEFGLPEEGFLFLFTFDYNSFVARKNPGAVIAAFRAAFPPSRDDVGLVVKSVNGVRRPDRVAEIQAQVGGDRRIHHVDTFLDRDASYGLLSVTDCYVSLHRSEGLGLGIAEAMLVGKPAIATGYSGNLEFMSEANSLLVDYSIVPLEPGDYLYDDTGLYWAEPDVDDAARNMRRIVDDAGLRLRLATEGPAAVARVFGRSRSAALLRERLAELGMLPA